MNPRIGPLNPTVMGKVGENLSDEMFDECRVIISNIETFVIKTLRKNKKHIKSIAKDLLKKATEIDENLIAAKRLIADIYWRQGGKENIKKAREIHKQALEQAKNIGDTKETAEGLVMVGYYHFDDKEYDKATELFEQSIKMFEKLDDQLGIAKGLNAMGNLSSAVKKHDAALDYYTRSLDIGQKIDDKIPVSYTHLTLPTNREV